MTPVLPGGSIGILGGGQLARMMALEARRMGYRIHVLDPDPAGPAAQVADSGIGAAYDDLAMASRLAERSDVITIDTEHIPFEVLESLESILPVRPGASVLRTVQDRLQQRRFLEGIGAPQPSWFPIDNLETLRSAAAMLGGRSVLKTRRAGYDGKGQARLAGPEDAPAAWSAIDSHPSILESFVPFDRELSILLARDVRGSVRFYPLAENVHRRHILHTTRMPAVACDAVRREAEELGVAIAEGIGHVGMMAVELFLVGERKLLVNEIAPRTHNSGHVTYGGAATSQFEQHLRAICGLPLGETDVPRSAVMVNLLGDLWRRGEPRWDTILRHSDARLHLYGKRRAEPGRKMGHVLLLGDDADRNLETAQAILRELEPKSDGSSDPHEGPRAFAAAASRA